jgi:lipoate-protein ligase A
MQVCRLLPYAIADGALNMAADEALLESAVAGIGSLRFYGWSEPTVSLGYFQSHLVREDDPLLAVLPYVRRPTGGATLVHHHEVTYALALPAGKLWQAHDAPWLRGMHEIIAAALCSLGVAATPVSTKSAEPFVGALCFQHLTGGDLLIGPGKVVGSAQRRQRGALLQHGAILLAQSRHAPLLPGIRELSGVELSVEEVSSAATREFTRQTGWCVEAADWTTAEKERAQALRTTRYRSAKWNRKR